MSVGAFEKKFVVSGISDGIRMDGRSLRSPRSITIRANTVDLSPGSVTVSYGDCCVTAGMRMDLQKPAPERADEGIVDFYVSMTSVSDRVDPELLQNNTEERLQSVAFHLASAFRANSAPALRSLCVKPGQLCWYVKVIIEVLQSCGNLVDTCSIAAKAVLHMLRLPVVGVASSRKKGTTAVELNQDPDAFVSIDMSNVPLLATVARINSYCLVDPTEMELFAADSIAVVGVNRQCNDTAGRICYFSKDLSNSMDLSSTVDMMNEGCLVISCIAPALLEILDDPERISVEGRKLRLNREAEQ